MYRRSFEGMMSQQGLNRFDYATHSDMDQHDGAQTSTNEEWNGKIWGLLCTGLPRTRWIENHGVLMRWGRTSSLCLF